MDEQAFVAAAVAAGLTEAAARLLYGTFAVQGHTHSAEEIVVDPEDGETLGDWGDNVNEALAALEES